MKKILVIDVGGTHVKLMISRAERRKFDSGQDLGPKQLVKQTKTRVVDWSFDAISIGFPAPIRDGKILKEPKHLGSGWCDFDFAHAFDKPIKIINDAALQALGSYHGGRMLFLGLGTGLGSALIWEKNIMQLELGDLPYGDGEFIEEYLGKPGLEEFGRKTWLREVEHAVTRLKLAFVADYVVLGGGNAKLLDELPDGAELGHNRNVFPGGTRLWQTEPRSRREKWNVI